MKLGDRLEEGESLISGNMKFEMRVTRDGRLVVEEIVDRTTCEGRVVFTEVNELWVAPARNKTNGSGSYMVLQDNDGNFCFYNKEKNPFGCRPER